MGQFLQHSERLASLVRDADVDLFVLSSLIQLLAAVVQVEDIEASLDTLDGSSLDQLNQLMHVGLANILMAIAMYWPCCDCRTKMFQQDFISEPEAIGCQRLWDDFDEDLMYSAEKMLHSIFKLTTIPYFRALFTQNIRLIMTCLHLTLSFIYCRSCTNHRITNACLLYALRVIGQCCAEASNADQSDVLQLPSLRLRMLSIVRFVCVSLACRMNWVIMSAEVCLTLANFVASVGLSIFFSLSANNAIVEAFIQKCILPSLNLDQSFGEAIRLLNNSILASSSNGTESNVKHWFSVLNELEKVLIHRNEMNRILRNILPGVEYVTKEMNSIHVLYLRQFVHDIHQFDDRCESDSQIKAFLVHNCRILGGFINST